MPLAASIVPKEMQSEAISEASGQVNGATAVQDTKDQVVESAVSKVPVVQQDALANPSVTAAEQPVPPAEAPPSPSGETLAEEKGATTEDLVDSQETAVAGKTESQALEFTKEIVAEVKLAAEVVPVEPKLFPCKDPVVVDHEVGKASVATESTDECVDEDDNRKTATQDPGLVSGYKNVDLAIKIENPVQREPVAVDHKGIQSNKAGASHSTRQLSGGLPYITFIPTH